ncbi:hypothetical protein QMK33_19085 [Hymenobacter sp. H14-R3]|uniref:hypothetical protein n=1 Tax=Hymenobacter sp. H14-R3 TaxID=3046308 RepID=UPI0024B912E9|nr:hypothetical protein [Hymenobacter sp. H14-R3]MDJ0367258.1 hypothetical protein [Hymenobacter sp. H14-R3]
MPSFNDQVFLYADLALTWGLTLEATEAALPAAKRLPTYGGWPTLRCRCPSAYGLATTECSLRAPGRRKPVLQASYELAPPPHHGSYVIDPAYWLVPLTHLLGPPGKAGSSAGPSTSSNVVHWATWQRPTVRVSLSVFGGLREDDGAVSAAGLYLDWQDERTAAQPSLAAALAQSAALAARVGAASKLLLFATAQPQGPYFHPDLSQPAPYTATPGLLLRQAQRALYGEDLLDTPAAISARLTDHGVALWPVPGGAQWAVSTRWDTVLLTPAGPPTDLLTLRPARGTGGVLLHVGDLQLPDAYGSSALATLATAIEKHVGAAVSRREDSDY